MIVEPDCQETQEFANTDSKAETKQTMSAHKKRAKERTSETKREIMEKKNKREKIDMGTDQQYIFVQALIYTCIYTCTNTEI